MSKGQRERADARAKKVQQRRLKRMALVDRRRADRRLVAALKGKEVHA